MKNFDRDDNQDGRNWRPLLDFTEFPKDGEAWEQFAREFLGQLGFTIDIPPGRGPDGGRDLLVLEPLTGLIGTSTRRWLVSCKHFAHGGNAVGLDSEINIADRMKQFGGEGFMGFYSTLPSTPLVERLESMREGGVFQSFEIFDNKRIESLLVQKSLFFLLTTFFPRTNHNVRPLAKLFSDYRPLPCEICDRDLLEEQVIREGTGMVVYGWDTKSELLRQYVSVHAVCKGDCDRILSERLKRNNVLTNWKDVSDFTIPTLYAEYVSEMIVDWSDDRYPPKMREDMCQILLKLAQRVMRTPTANEAERYRDLTEWVIAPPN